MPFLLGVEEKSIGRGEHVLLFWFLDHIGAKNLFVVVQLSNWTFYTPKKCYYFISWSTTFGVVSMRTFPWGLEGQ